jgi:hypothetical protein
MDKGVILMGEAAQAYIQYKYAELTVIGLVLGGLVIALVYLLFRVTKD